MSNILSYLKWRGDLTLLERPFNELDNLVLSLLAYFNFSDIIASDDQEIRLYEAYQQYFFQERKINGLLLTIDEDILREAAYSNRFKNCRLSHYVEITQSHHEQTQFAAMKIRLDDGTCYISFRGTDDTLVGWKEDFSLTYQITAAQKKAVSYLQTVVKPDEIYRLGGHSKGGLLAVYGAMMISQQQQDQIIEIYNNDGPGICFDYAPIQNYLNIQSKIKKFVPQFDIVGMLFENENNVTVIKSQQTGLLQHGLCSWEVERSAIVRGKGLDKECQICNEILKGLLDNVDAKEREEIIEDFFNRLFEAGLTTLSDIGQHGVEGLLTVLKALNQAKHISHDVIKKVTIDSINEIKNRSSR